MRRYWVPKEAFGQDQIFLSGEIYHHIFNVCRRHLGHRFEVLVEGTGKAFLVEVCELQKKQALAKVISERTLPELLKPHIHVALSLPKFSTFEKILEPMVELGVAQLHPFVSEYSFLKNTNKISSSKVQRWEKVIQGATQQSARRDTMKLSEVVPLAELLSSWKSREESAVGVFAYEGEGKLSLSQALQKKRLGGLDFCGKRRWVLRQRGRII